MIPMLFSDHESCLTNLRHSLYAEQGKIRIWFCVSSWIHIRPQALRQDLAEGGNSTGHIFKIQHWMYASTGGPNVRWRGRAPLATALGRPAQLVMLEVLFLSWYHQGVRVGHKAPGRRKPQQCRKYFLQCSTYAPERPYVRTWGRQTRFLPRTPSNLGTLLCIITQQMQAVCE